MNRRTRIAAGVIGALIAVFIGWRFAVRRHASVHRDNSAENARADAEATESPVAANARPHVIETFASDGGDVVETPPATPRDTRVRAGWGSGAGQLGRRLSSDGDPESPNSFVVDAQGNVLVLDQMNHRVLRFGSDGGTASVAAQIDSATARDLAVSHDGSMAVLDANPDAGTIRVMGPDGRPRGDLAIRGANMQADDHATGVVIDGDDVYVERDHGPLIRVGTTSGGADTSQTEIPGRPSRDGRLYLSGGITDPDQGRYWVNAVDRATNEHRFTLELHTILTLQRMMLLDTDRAGTVYVAVMGLTPETGEHDVRETIQLDCLDPDTGRLIGHANLPSSNLHEDVQRELAVLDDGGVLLTVRSDDGFAVQRFDCQ